MCANIILKFIYKILKIIILKLKKESKCSLKLKINENLNKLKFKKNRILKDIDF